MNHNQFSIVMAPKSYTQQSFCVNFLADPTGEQDEHTSQSPVQRFNVKSNEAPIKALTPPKTLTLPFVPLFIKDFFTKFMKMFMETMQTPA